MGNDDINSEIAASAIMRIQKLFLLTAAITLSSCLAAEAGAKPIVIGGDQDFPPYEFIGRDGRPTGYNVDLTLAIAEVMDLDVEIVLGNWDSMRTALETDEIDVLQGTVFSESRSELYSFSPPHSNLRQSVFARSGSVTIDAIEDLRGKEVIVQRDGAMHDYLLENNIGAEIFVTDTHANALRLLSSGKHHYAVVANLPGVYVGLEFGLSNISPVYLTVEDYSYGYAVSRGNEDLLALFTEGLAILDNTGRKQDIYDKWIAPLEDKGLPWKTIGQITGVTTSFLVLLVGIILVWNRTLHRQVEARTSELQRNQQKLVQADKMTSLGILVSGVAHEINNPTSLLMLNLPVIEEVFEDAKPILDDHYKHQGDFKCGGLQYSRIKENVPLMISDLQDATNNIKRIVEDLRGFSREGYSDETERANFNEIVALAIRLASNSIQDSTQHFSVNYGDNLPFFMCNPQRIEQVVINLILNACQALPDRDKSITLKTHYDAKRGRVVLKVVDQGMGIKSEHLERLTDPFFTTKRNEGGTGLGLFVSASIVQEHGGELLFESILEKGTTATLLLPLST